MFQSFFSRGAVCALLFSVSAMAILPTVKTAYAQEKVLQDAVQAEPALTLDQAIQTALIHSPSLGASLSRAEAATAARSQAGALPNPEVSVEAENIYGNGPYKGLDSAEMTYGVSQLVELPGKRSNRIRVAESEKSRIHLASDATRLDLIRDVTIAYAEAVAAKHELDILSNERDLAAAVRDSVAAKVEAGREPPIQKNKAQIELSTSEIARDRASRALETKKQALFTLMGQSGGSVPLNSDSLPALIAPEPLETYRSRLPQTPDVKSLDADVGQAEATYALEKANAVPDPTLGVGVRQFKDTDNKAFVASLSFPIPVFNMNRSGISRAGHELNAAKLDQRGKVLGLDTELLKVYEDFESSFREANALEKDVLPGAEQAFEFARGGYDAGKFGYLDVLDAQRTLFEARKQFNTAVLEYYRQLAVIERMTALHADPKAKQPGEQP